jgi:hypothetical protein
MDNRPTSVTVISVLLIVFGAIGLLGVLAIVGLQDNPMIHDALAQVSAPVPVQIAMGSVGVLVSIGTGVACILRKGWMRFVYIGWWVISFIYGYMVNPLSIISVALSVVFFGIVVYFLFTPKARAWFAGTGGTAPAA